MNKTGKETGKETTRKKLHSSRSVLTALIAGYVGILALLVTLDGLLLINQRTAWEKSVEDKISTRITAYEQENTAIGNYLYSIYADRSFQELGGKKNTAEAYDNVYEMRTGLDQFQMLYDRFEEYYIRYGNGNVYYRLNSSQNIAYENEDTLHSYLLNLHTEGLGLQRQYMTVPSGDVYSLTIYFRGNNLLAGICNLSNMAEEVCGSVEDYADSRILLPEDLEDEEVIAAYPVVRKIDNEQSVTITKDWNSIEFAFPVQNGDFWILTHIDRPFSAALTPVAVIMILMTILSACAVYWIYRIMNKYYFHPMYQLIGVMEDHRRRPMGEIPDLRFHFYELDLVNRTLSEMVEEIQRQKNSIYEEQLNRQETELQLRQIQLQPHFFLNCMKVMNTMAVNAGMEDLQKLVLKISNYLRYLLTNDQMTILLREELSFTREYVDLQNLLTGRHIELTVEEEEDLGDWIVPILCIQSFVENSIKYVNPQNNKVDIHVSILRLDMEEEDRQVVDITVQDSGDGYPESMLPRMNARGDYEGAGIGINNIKRRIELLYGETAEYSFYNMDGAVSELILPPQTLGKEKGSKQEN